MGEEVFFCPTLVIFVDKVGNDIYQQLCQPALVNGANKSEEETLSVEERICNLLQPTAPLESLLEHISVALRRTIGLIRQDGDAYRSRRADSEEESDLATLPNALCTMLSSIAKSLSIPSHTQAGYSLQIYVVGHICAPGMREIVKTLKATVHSYDPTYLASADASINYLYCYYPTTTLLEEDQQSTPIPVPDDLTDWASQNKVNFCFLYEIVDDPTATFRQDKASVDYAMALSLLALVATGISASAVFKKAIQLRTDGRANFGTLNTCLIEAPRNVIRTACRAYITARILTDWLDTRHVQQEAQESARNMRLEMETILQNDEPSQIQKFPLSELQSDLSYEDWSGKKLWQEEASKLWQERRLHVEKLLEKELAASWNEPAKDAPWIIAYVDELDLQLNELKEPLSKKLQQQNIQDLQEIKNKEEYIQYQKRIRKAQQEMPTCQQIWFSLAVTALAFPVFWYLLLNIAALLFGAEVFHLPQIIVIGMMPLVLLIGTTIFWIRHFQEPERVVKRDFMEFHQHHYPSYYSNYHLNEGIALVETMQQRISCLTSRFIKDACHDFYRATKLSFSVLFKNSIGNSTIFIGNGSYFEQDEQSAIRTFVGLEEEKAQEDLIHPSPAEQLFQDVKLELFQHATAALQTMDWQKEPEKRRNEFYAVLCHVIQTVVKDELIDKMISFKASIDVRYEDLWNEVLAALMERHLWRRQVQDPRPSTFFLCGSKEALSITYPQTRSIAQIYQRDIVQVSAADLAIQLDESLPDWQLIVALYQYI